MRSTVLLVTCVLAACTNAPSDSNGDPVPHRFERPAAVPEAAGVLVEQPEEFVIYALDPLPVSMQELDADTPVFHGYRVLGSEVLRRNRDREALVDLLYRGIAADDGTRAACFNPRHGIRAVRGRAIADWVICFECLSLHVIDENGEQTNLGTKSFVEPEFSAIYEAAGLVLDKR